MSEQDRSTDSINKLIFGENTLSILGARDESDIQIVTPWCRGGSETYITDFLLKRDNSTPQHLIAKACIKFGAKAAMAEWMSRRAALEANGVNMPEFITLDDRGASLVEEFIPYSFREAYTRSDDLERMTLRHNFVSSYLRIEGAGFNPISLHDVRSRGNDVVVIDVGEDMGHYTDISLCSMGAYVRAEKSLRSILSQDK